MALSSNYLGTKVLKSGILHLCSVPFFFNIVQFQFNKHLLQRTDSKIHHLNIPEMGIIQKVER